MAGLKHSRQREAILDYLHSTKGSSHSRSCLLESPGRISQNQSGNGLPKSESFGKPGTGIAASMR